MSQHHSIESVVVVGLKFQNSTPQNTHKQRLLCMLAVKKKEKKIPSNRIYRIQAIHIYPSISIHILPSPPPSATGPRWSELNRLVPILFFLLYIVVTETITD